MKIKENIPLSNYTTFKIGGPAKYFAEVKTKKDLIEAIKFARQKNLPFFILGGGSNILVSDEGYNGLVINFQFSIFNFQENKIVAGAGAKLKDLVRASAERGLTGIEWAAGIPGTVGGAIYGNAAAFGKSISEIIKEVEVFDVFELKIKNYRLKDCKFNYKESIFKKNKNLIILSCILNLKKGNKKEIKEKIKYFLDYRERH
ncbi:FAD-binding protein, partial [bacterium]|nr:FAD-binding protein [bacterium]